MNQPQPIDLDDLEAKANAATKGQWKMTGDGQLMANGKTLHCYVQLPSPVMQAYWRNQADVPFIVAAQPQTVLSLIARVRELEAKVIAAGEALLDQSISKMDEFIEHQGQMIERLRNLVADINANEQEQAND